MSLILEALRKLEREKQNPDRGFLVMAHTPWGAGRRWSTLTLAGLVLAVAAGASLLTVLVVRKRPGPVTPVTEVASPQPARSSAPAAGVEQRPMAAAALATSSPVTPFAQTAPVPVTDPEPPVPPSAAASPPPAAPAAVPSLLPAAPTHPDLRLLAISQQDGRPVAIVNDRLVREGDSFDGIRILRIGATEVEVEIHGQKRVLTFQ